MKKKWRGSTNFFFSLWFLFSFIPLFFLFSQRVLALNFSIGAWEEVGDLPNPLASHAVFVYENRIFILGGGSSVHTSNIISAEIDATGNLSGWDFSSTGLPESLIWHSVVRDGNRIYLLGGGVGSSATANVYTTTIEENGQINNWQQLTSLPQPRALGEAEIFNRRVYYFGGAVTPSSPSPQIQPDVFSAQINEDGTLDSWRYETPLPVPRMGFALFKTDRSFILAGGAVPGSSATRDVIFANVGSSGLISSWSSLTPLPEQVQRPSFLKLDQYLVLAGGYDGSSINRASVYFSELQTDGLPGNWERNPEDLRDGNCCARLVKVSDFLFLVGGFATGDTIWDYTTDIFRAGVSISPFGLGVPDVKQYTMPWGDDEYDDASEWTEGDETISRWGCALTSASMVLQYFNHMIDPAGLNDWLKAQTDGFIRNGLVNWLAISRYTRENVDESAGRRALEYTRHGADDATLEEELDNDRPGILRLPGHFVVARGEIEDDFLINDPSSTETSLTGAEETWGGEYSAIGSYVPSSTDLSYVMLVIDEGVAVEVFDKDGNPVGESSIEDALKASDGATSGKAVRVFLLAKPKAGNYRIVLSGNDDLYQLDAYLYDSQGEVRFQSIEGILGEGEEFGVLVGEESEGVFQEVTIETIIADWKAVWATGLVKNRTVYKVILKQLEVIKKVLNKNRRQVAKGMIEAVERQIVTFTPEYIDPGASDILQRDLEILRGRI